MNVWVPKKLCDLSLIAAIPEHLRDEQLTIKSYTKKGLHYIALQN